MKQTLLLKKGLFIYNRLTILFILLLVVAFTVSPQTVTPWMTSGDKSNLLQQQSTVSFSPTTGTSNVNVSVDPTVT